MAAGLELGRYLEAGDLRRAGEWLVRNYAADVVAMCRAMVRERHTAEDLAQDAFSSAFSNLTSFRREASPRTWILAITRNRCIDHLRRLSRDPWGGAAAEEPEPDHYADEAPLPADVVLHRADLEAAMSTLAEGERALVVLRFRHGLEYAELANVFGLREGTVRMRLSRALAKMRGELEALDQTALRARVTPVAAAAPSAPPLAPMGRMPPPSPAAATPPPAARSRAAPPPPQAATPPQPAFGAAAPPAAPPPPPPAARPSALSSAAPPRAGWWTRLLSWLGVVSASTNAPSGDEQPSAELRERLEAMVRRLPSS